MILFAKPKDFAKAFNQAKRENWQLQFSSFRAGHIPVSTAKQFIELAREWQTACLLVQTPTGSKASISFQTPKNKVKPIKYTAHPDIKRVFGDFLTA